MPYGVKGSIEKTFRAMILALTGIAVDMGSAAATAGAATLNSINGKITSESLTTAQNAVYTLTLTNNQVAAEDQVFWSVANGTNTQGTVVPLRATPAAGSIVFTIANKHDSAQAFNGTLVVSYEVRKALSAAVAN